MAGDTTLTIVGNLTADPELRFSPSGVAVADFTIASTPRRFDKTANEWKDGETLFVRCSIWREAAENVAESLRKGMRVIAVGNLVQRSWEDRDGNKRTSVELQVEEVGPSLRRAKAVVTRTGGRSDAPQAHGNGPQAGWQGQTAPAQGQQSDPWGQPSTEVPF